MVMGILTFISLSGNIGPYSFPSSAQALDIIRHGKISLPPQLPVSSYWANTLFIEKDYPVASIILAIFYLTTSISPDFLPFLPISGFMVFIFYYIILKTLLEIKGTQSLYGKGIINALLSLLIVIYDLFNRNIAYYVGRATLGVAFFMVITYLLLKLIANNRKSSWIIVTLIVLLATSFAYYTTILAAFIALFLFFFFNIIRLLKLEQRTREAIFSLVIVSLFLVVIQPIINVLSLSPGKFVNNLISWILAQLKIEQNEAYYLTVGSISMDLFTRISTIWLGFSLKLTFIFTFICYILNELIKERKLNMRKPANILAVITVSASLADLSYTFQAPTISLRYITMLSIFYVPLVVARVNRAKIKKTFGLAISILLIVFCVGTFNSILLYGRVNDVRYLYGFNEFISGIITSHNVVIAGDSYYTGYLFFKTSLGKDYTGILFTTLGIRTFDLFGLHSTDSIINCVRGMISKDVGYLIIVNDGKPITGDPWGYAVTPSNVSINFLINHSNIIYYDGDVYLLNFVLM
jgi:hypothetical protein